MLDLYYGFALDVMTAAQVLPQPLRFPCGALVVLFPLVAPLLLGSVVAALASRH